MTTNESKSPAASAAGAKRCSLAGAADHDRQKRQHARRQDRQGSSQECEAESAEAHGRRLERTFQKRFDVAWIGLADRAGDFLGALVHDQGALLLGF